MNGLNKTTNVSAKQTQIRFSLKKLCDQKSHFFVISASKFDLSAWTVKITVLKCIRVAPVPDYRVPIFMIFTILIKSIGTL